MLGVTIAKLNMLKVRKCVDLISSLSHNCSGHDSDDRGEHSSPDIIDKTFKINPINSSNI